MSVASPVVVLSALAGTPAASAAVDVSPRAVALPGSLRIDAGCPAGASYTSATVEIPELDRTLVVHVDDGRVRTRVSLVAPADRVVERFDVQVTCRAADGERADAGSRRVRVEQGRDASTTPVAAAVTTASADDGEPVSRSVPLAVFAAMSVVVFVAYGLLGRGQRGERGPRRARR